jgi:plasmid stabilization system protein ParE
MRLPVVILPSARVNGAQATAWLDEQRPGLGDDFLTELDRLVNLIAHYPECCQRFRGSLRRGFLRRFDYAVVYRVARDAVEVVAIVHCRRNFSRRRSIVPE